MPDTKMIALARRIVQAGDVGEYRWPEETTRVLSRALLDATSPGAQYRAGMERAMEVIKPFACSICAESGAIGAARRALRMVLVALPASPEPVPVFSPKAELRRLLNEPDPVTYTQDQLVEANAAARRLEAPVVMPALRWEKNTLDLGGSVLMLGGGLGVGSVFQDPDDEGDWWHGWVAAEGDDICCPTESEARAAVEAAVRERLAALPAPTTEEQHGK